MPLNEQGIFEYDSGFLKNQESAEAYSGTPEDIEDQQLESSEEAQAVRSETALNEQDHFGNIPLLSSMARTTAIGVTDLINETDKFFGVSNAIQKRYDIQLGENTLLYTPEEMGLRPRHLFESFGSTIIPFALPFVGIAKVPGTLQLASKLTTSLGLLKNSKRLKGALDGILGSIPVDTVVWNPDDPNWVNQVTSGIAVNDTGVMATLRDWLATNPDDPDAWNRGRNAFVNIWAGVVGEGLFALLRGTGSFAKSVVSAPKELKNISKENAEIIAKAVEKAKKEKPQEVQELLEKLPEDTRRAEDFLEPETAGEALAKNIKGSAQEDLNAAAFRTAITRTKVSLPTKALITEDKIKGRVLHHGAGVKTNPDRKIISEKASESVDFDPYHSPETSNLVGKQDFDQVVSNFVLNVITRGGRTGRDSAIKDIASSMTDDGVAFISVRGTSDVPANTAGSSAATSKKAKGWEPFEDGWKIPKKVKLPDGTVLEAGFQKGYSKEELEKELSQYFTDVKIGGTSAVPTAEVRGPIRLETTKPKASASNPANEYHQTPSPKRDIKSPLYKVTAEEEKAIIKLAEDALDRPLAGGKGVKVGKNIDIDDPKFPVNMWKLDGPEQIRALIHGIGRVLEPKLAKSIKMEDLTKGASDLTGVNASKIMEVAKSTEYARGFVVASRLVQMKAADDYLKALDEYLLNPADVEKQFNMNMAKLQAAEAVHAGADFSTAAGRLLNEFKQVADNATVAEQAELWRMDVMNNIIDSGKVTLKKAQRARKLATEQASQAKATRAGDIDPEVVRAKRKKTPKTDERAEDITNIAKKTRQKLKKARRATPSELQGLLASSHQSLFARTRNAVLENYINGLLSNPKTQLVNIAGNTSAILTSIFERAYAGFKNEGIDGVQGREVYHLLIGMNEARKDALSMFMKAFREGPSDFSIKNDFSKPYQRAISKENFGASGNLGRVIDWVGDKVNIPGRLLMSADEVFKAINYRGEVRALAHRKAYKDVAEQLGYHPKTDAERALVVEKYGKMFEENNLPQEILDGAKDFARKNTFTNDLGSTTIIGRNGKPQQVAGFSASIRNAIEAEPTGLGKVLVPFFQTPVNLIKYGAERTPILRWLTPLRHELADTAPTAVRQIAEAKVATGNFIAASGVMMGLGGLVTGAPPKDPQLKQRYEAAGILPYHIWTPLGYRPYNRFDPLGMTLAASGNFGILARALIDIRGHEQRYGLQQQLLDAYETAFSQFTLGTARLLSDRHYLQTFGLISDLMQGDSRAWSQFGRNLAVEKLIVPYSSLRKALVKGINPVKSAYIHEESQFEEGDTLTEFVSKGFSQSWDTWLEETTRLVPGWGQPPLLNEIGESTHYPGSEFNDDLHFAPARILRGMLNETLNLAAETPRSKSPLLNKLAELDMGQQTPRDVKSIDGVPLSSEEHQFYSERVGKYNKELESYVRSKDFLKEPEGEQKFQLEMRLKRHKMRATSDTKRQFDRIRQTSLYNTRSKRTQRNQDIAGNNLGGFFNNKGQQ